MVLSRPKVATASPHLPFEIEEGSALVIRGGTIKEQPISLQEATGRLDTKVVVWGDIFDIPDRKEVKNGQKTILIYYITDYTGSIMLKMFIDTKKLSEAAYDKLKNGCTVVAKGNIEFDTFNKDITLMPMDLMLVKRKIRMDNAPKKRVESRYGYLTCPPWTLSVLHPISSPVPRRGDITPLPLRITE